MGCLNEPKYYGTFPSNDSNVAPSMSESELLVAVDRGAAILDTW